MAYPKQVRTRMLVCSVVKLLIVSSLQLLRNVSVRLQVCIYCLFSSFLFCKGSFIGLGLFVLALTLHIVSVFLDCIFHL